VKEHGCFGCTERNVGKQLQRSALFRAQITLSRRNRHLSKWTNEKRIEQIVATLGLSSLHGDHLPRIICLEELSGFLNRCVFINCFDGADPILLANAALDRYSMMSSSLVAA
jgi:hypothetical protein